MDVFGKGTAEPSRPLLPPGTCWICESSPTQEVEKVIDTRRNARAGGALSHESVRKYICESCARELGAAVGMVHHDEWHRAMSDKAAAEGHSLSLQQQLDKALASQTRVVSVDDVVQALAAANDVLASDE